MIRVSIVVSLLLALLAGVPVVAAPATGVVEGIVTSGDGRAIAGARVTIERAAVSRQVDSGADGRFRFTHLFPGDYAVMAEAEGFETLVRLNVEVLPWRTTDTRFTLEPSEVEQIVMETAEGELLTVVDVAVATSLREAELGGVPHRRSIAAVLSTLPLISIGADGVSMPGAPAAATVWRADSIVIRPSPRIEPALLSSFDAVDAIRVIAAGGDARLGGAGAVALVTTSAGDPLQLSLRAALRTPVDERGGGERITVAGAGGGSPIDERLWLRAIASRSDRRSPFSDRTPAALHLDLRSDMALSRKASAVVRVAAMRRDATGNDRERTLFAAGAEAAAVATPRLHLLAGVSRVEGERGSEEENQTTLHAEGARTWSSGGVLKTLRVGLQAEDDVAGVDDREAAAFFVSSETSSERWAFRIGGRLESEETEIDPASRSRTTFSPRAGAALMLPTERPARLFASAGRYELSFGMEPAAVSSGDATMDEVTAGAEYALLRDLTLAASWSGRRFERAVPLPLGTEPPSRRDVEVTRLAATKRLSSGWLLRGSAIRVAEDRIAADRGVVPEPASFAWDLAALVQLPFGSEISLLARGASFDGRADPLQLDLGLGRTFAVGEFAVDARLDVVNLTADDLAPVDAGTPLALEAGGEARGARLLLRLRERV